MNYFVNLNLNKNELQNARIQNLAAAPANPVKGQIYYDTTIGGLFVYNGTDWERLDNQTVVIPVTSVSAGAGLTNTGTAKDPVIAMPNVGTAGTYFKTTVDAQGRVTSGTNPTTLSGFGITDAVNSSEVSTTAAANKILKLDANGKLPASITGNADGNAATATKLQTARTISLTGDVTGSVSFDGSGNASITTSYKASGVTAGTYSKVTVDAKGTVTAGSTLAAADIPTLTLSKISDAGTAASKDTGTAAGNVPILDASGKLDTAVLPGLALTTTNVVATEAAMLALTAEPGDLAVRTDLKKTFVLKAEGASTLANWQELLTPTDSVTSVAGKTGVVTLTASDVGLGNVTNESKATMFANAALTGTPTAPTAAAATNNTQIATTAFVKSQGYLTGNQTITVSGDATGSGTSSIALTLANSGVTAGTYKSVTVDAKGRVTAGTNPTTISGYGITDAYTKTEHNKLRAEIIDNYVVSGLAVTTNATALTVSIATGVVYVGGVRYTPAATSKTITAAAVNYIYVNASGVITVSTTAPTGDYADLATIASTAAGAVVAAGSITDTRDIITNTNGKLVYDLYNDTGSYAQVISSRGPGSGLLVKSAGTADTFIVQDIDTAKDMFRIDGSGNVKHLNGSDLYIYSDDGVTQKFFVDGATGNTTVGGTLTVTGAITGSISGNAGTATKLATARTISLTGDVTGSGTFDGSANLSITATVADDSHNHTIANVDSLQTELNARTKKFTVAIGDGAATTFTKAHGLGNADLVVTVRDAATGEIVYCDVTVDATNIVLTFASAPAANAYKLVAIG